MNLNKVQIIWYITKDIELKQTSTWQHVSSFSVATNSNFTDKNWIKQTNSEFHNIVFWWKLAEISQRYANKWKLVFIEGRLQTKSWESEDWSKRYKTEIIWEKLILLWNSTQNLEAVKKSSPKNEKEISIEDIPF